MARSNRSGSIRKAFGILWFLRRAVAPQTLTEIASGVEVPPSTVHAILATLVEQGAVAQDGDRRYRLGPTVFYLGAAYARHAPIRRAVWDDLTQLARFLKLTAVIAVPWGAYHLILDVYSDHEAGHVDVAVGGRVPLDAGSFGKAYFAYANAAIPEVVHRFTSRTVPTRSAYEEEVRKARLTGYGTDDEEFVLGVGGVAAAVTSEQGFEGIAALVGPIRRFRELEFDTVGTRLASIAARASFILGDVGRVQTFGGD